MYMIASERIDSMIRVAPKMTLQLDMPLPVQERNWYLSEMKLKTDYIRCK